MADRATIDTMNKVLDNLFGTKKYAGGTPQGVGRGNPQASRDSLQDYAEELLMGGLSPQQVAQVLARTHYQMKGHGNADLGIAELTAELHKDLTRRQETLQPQMQSFRYDQRNAFVAYHAKNAALTGHTKNIEDELTRLGITDPQEREMYKKEAYTARSTTYAFPALNRELESVQGSSKPELEKWRKSLGRIVTRDVKFDQMLHAIGVGGSMGHMIAKPVRKLIRATETGLVGQHAFNVPQSAARNYKSSPKQANLTPISLPANPAAITQSLAVKFVAEQKRQQAMQQSASLGQTISRSNFLKTLARQNKPSGQASSANLNFLGSRGTHQPTLFDRLRESKLGRRLGFESTNPVNYKAAGVGLAGGLSYLAMQYAPQAIDALSSGLAHMAGGFFARGGSVPGYAYGGDPLRNIHLTKSPESASKLIGSNVVNSLQSDANSTGIHGLLQSMIKSGSNDSSFRGLFYRKGLNANEWMEKVHQMKLQSADTFMNGYFAQGGVPRFAKGTSDEIPFNFKHFSIGRNSKFIKQMFDLSAPYMNDSDGQYQMFRAIENKKMGPKDFGLLAATLKDMNPVSALSYQSDGSGIEMTDLGTHPKFQKQGFGQVLLAEMLNIGKDKGLDLATWSANSDEAAGYYNYLGAKEGENKSFTFDLNEWTGKFAKRRAIGGDTFPQQLASGPNSQISADAIKRLQLLRIRAQAGNRLASLRDNAQLNMQLGNTSLFRSPNTAAGVINARVLNNLQSIFSGQKGQKFASGGSTLNNPIRVSDGELAIPRGMVDKIGLSTLRRINAGDMSGLQGFSAGGMFEFDGPGTGTSDSILTDADRGPKGQDASDIGFIIRRTSSDRLKSIVGRAMGGIIPGYAEGDQPMDNHGNVIPASSLRQPSMDFIREQFKQYEGAKYIGKKTVFPAVTKALESIKEFTNINDLLDTVMQAVDSTNVIHESSKSVGGKISPYERAFRNSRGALSNAFGDIYNQFDPAAVTDVQESETRNKKSLDDQTDAINDVTEAERRREKAINDAIKSITDQQGGMYRGNVRYARHGEFGENDLRYIGDDVPSRTELTSEQDRLGEKRKEPHALTRWYRRNLSGVASSIGREMFNPMEQRTSFQTQIKMPIFMDDTKDPQIQEHLDKSFKEFSNLPDIVRQELRQAFGPYLGDRVVDEMIKVSSTTEDGMVEIPLGTRGELYEKSQKTHDGISVGAANDPKNIKDASVLETSRTKQTLGVITIDVNPDVKKLEKAGGFNVAEVLNQIIQRVKPETGPLTRKMGGENIDVVKAPTVGTKMMSELAQKTSMTNTGLYKTGDILRGLSWRAASLSMSAMGVYFSIQGLMMTMQQGLGAIMTPLSDIEALFKSIGMSSAFGMEKDIFSAKNAMEQLNVSQQDFIDGWKNLTNIQGTIQTLFGSIGAKIFGGAEGTKFTDEILKGITEAFRELEKGGIAETVRDLIRSIVDALPAILPAIKTITGLLQDLSKNKGIVSFGAQLMVLSLVVQPITSGLAAVLTILGGIATFSNIFITLSTGIWATSAASAAATPGLLGMATALKIMSGLTVIGGFIMLYEVLANIVNLMGGINGWKFPTLTGLALGAMSGGNGYAAGGEIGGTATAAIDDKTINVEEGEFVVKKDVAQRHRRELAQFNKTGVWPGSQKMAGGGFTLLPSAMVNSTGPLASFGNDLPAVQKSFEANRIAGLTEVTKDNTGKSSKVLTDVQEGDTLAVTVRNWPPSWKGESGEGSELPFDLGSALPEKLFGFKYNVNPNAGNPNTNVLANGNTSPLGWLANILSTSIKDNSKDNSKDTSKDNSKDNANTTVEPNDSLLAYIKDTLKIIYDSIKRAGDAIVQSVQDTVEVITSGLMGALVSLMDTASRAAEVIGNITVALSKIDVIAPLKSAGSAIVEGIKSIPQTVAGLPSSIVEGGMNFLTNGLNTANAQDIKYHHAGYRKWGDVTDYGPIPGQVKNTGFWDRFKNGKYVYPEQPYPKGQSPSPEPLGQQISFDTSDVLGNVVQSFDDFKKDFFAAYNPIYQQNKQAQFTDPNYVNNIDSGLLIDQNLRNQKLGSDIDAHGILKGSFDDQIKSLDNILVNGVDTTKRFHTAPLVDYSGGAGAGLGTAGGAYTGGAFTLLSKPGESLIDKSGKTNIGAVLVNREQEALIDMFREQYKGTNFITADQVADYNTGKLDLSKTNIPSIGKKTSIVPGEMIYGPSKDAKYGKQMWTGWEKWILDFPVDLTPVMRDIVTSDSNPYAAALSMSSAITENALVGYGMGGMQRAAQSAPAWLSKLIGKGNVRNAISSGLAGKVPAALGAFGTEAMGLINHPGVVIGASLVEGQQAMDKWTARQSAASFKDPDSKYNQVTGLVTGGFVDAAFGKGIEVLADHFGKSEDVMRNEVNNSWASDLGLNTIWELIAGGGNIEKGKETTGDFGEKLKGGNLAVSDILRSIIPDNLKVENVPLIGSLSAEGIATGINENVYDLLATLGNLNVRSLTGAGTSFIGMGAALGELGGNTAQMLGENGMMAPYLGMSMLPFVGPFAAAMMMPQTTDWITNTRGYGMQNITPMSEEELRKTQQMPMSSSDMSVVTMLVDAIKTNNQPQNQQPQTITIPVQITVSGEELATKGYVDVTIEREVPNVIRQNQPRIVGH